MNLWIYLLSSYGITFFLQHKAYPLLSKIPFLKSMLECTFCTAFHAGWIAYLLQSWKTWNWSFVQLTDLFALSFASASAVYIIDAIVTWIESSND